MQKTESEMIKQAVRETLAGLGFDVTETKALQADMYYLRRLREGAEEAGKTMRHTLVGMLVSAALFLLWDAIRRVL